jgi:hypothetical protein
MAHDPYLFRRSWTLTAWSCLGALAVMTLLFVVIFETRRAQPGDERGAKAVAAMDRAELASNARHDADRARQEKLLY